MLQVPCSHQQLLALWMPVWPEAYWPKVCIPSPAFGHQADPEVLLLPVVLCIAFFMAAAALLPGTQCICLLREA